MNTANQTITPRIAIQKTILLCIALSTNIITMCMNAQLPLKTTIHNAYSVIFNEKNPHSALIVDKNKADQNRKQLALLVKFLPELSDYITKNAFGDKVLLDTLAAYKATNNQLAAILSRYLTKLATNDITADMALHDMLAYIKKLIDPLQIKLNNVQQPLRNQNLFSSFFDRKKTQKKDAQQLLVSIIEELNKAITTTQLWGEKMTQKPHRQSALQELEAINQENTKFEQDKATFENDKNVSRSHVLKTFRTIAAPWHPDKANPNDQKQIDRYTKNFQILSNIRDSKISKVRQDFNK